MPGGNEHFVTVMKQEPYSFRRRYFPHKNRCRVLWRHNPKARYSILGVVVFNKSRCRILTYMRKMFPHETQREFINFTKISNSIKPL